MNKVELLAPAGNLEKLKMAIIYGADAVYIGGEEFGLRASADNFSEADMKEGVEFAHKKGVKVYVTMNIIPHNEDLIGMEEYIKNLVELKVDAILISDPGVFSIVRHAAPEMEIHLSTQANNTNYKSALFWFNLGVKRVVLARELSLSEIKEIRNNTPNELELEAFVHGAMCISYSGRCLLSNYLAGRDSNMGQCAHPCRWKYYLMEEKRPGEYLPVYENERGTFIYNSKDLCMIEHIPEIIESGITSLKIEGRMKSSFYVALIVKAYREAIDKYCENPGNYRPDPEWMIEISKASHREYSTGFYFGKMDNGGQIYNTSSYIREYDFIGIVLEYDEGTCIAKVEQRNRMFEGDEIEVISPNGKFFKQKISNMKDEFGDETEVAQHPQMIVFIPMGQKVEKYSILRKIGNG
ncbi:MAG: U32 family peptidase [Clostridia bacterium]|jgi:putative protease